MSGTVFTTVGTDHHPFDRLVEWLDWVAAQRPHLRVAMQYGYSRRPSAPITAASLLTYPELQRHLADADVVIAHGGPATIMDARAAGHLPIVVPRRPDRGEHVDGHQVQFARRLSEAGEILLAEDRDSLLGLVDGLLRDDTPREVRRPEDTADTVRRFSELVDRLRPVNGRGPARPTRRSARLGR